MKNLKNILIIILTIMSLNNISAQNNVRDFNDSYLEELLEDNKKDSSLVYSIYDLKKIAQALNNNGYLEQSIILNRQLNKLEEKYSENLNEIILIKKANEDYYRVIIQGVEEVKESFEIQTKAQKKELRRLKINDKITQGLLIVAVIVLII